MCFRFCHLNRTFMELKQKREIRTVACKLVLIAPLWN